jgi:RNA polymerase sigma-70 factor (ECF subfamily)
MKETALRLQDIRLVEEIQSGQRTAEAALYEKYSERVYYLALSELRSPENAEDVRAETFLRVLQAIRQGQVRTPQALASFILGTAHYVILELLRRERKADQVARQEVAERDGRSDDLLFLDQGVKHAIEETIYRLKPREQAYLRMNYYEELSKPEIAQRLGVKEERLRLIKSRALKRFREVYRRCSRKPDTK